MQVSLKLYINNSSKLGHPLIVFFKDIGVRKRITVGKFLKNDMNYFRTGQNYAQRFLVCFVECLSYKLSK